MVDGILGFRALWLVRQSHALVLFVHGGMWPAGVGWWAVVVVPVAVVLGVVLVVVVVPLVAGALVAMAVVVGLVVVVVLWVRPQDPLAFRWGAGARRRLQPLGLHSLVDGGGKFGARLGGDRGRGVPRHQVRLVAGSGGF